jgi:hypothetical protein
MESWCSEKPFVTRKLAVKNTTNGSKIELLVNPSSSIFLILPQQQPLQTFPIQFPNRDSGFFQNKLMSFYFLNGIYGYNVRFMDSNKPFCGQ